MKPYAVVVAALLFVACRPTVKVTNSEFAPGVNPLNYTTFGFFKGSGSDELRSADFIEYSEQLKKAITNELTKKGYRKSDRDPDLMINIGLVVNEKVQTRETSFIHDAPQYIGQRRYNWKSKEVETGRYKVGTATIDVVDRKSALIWQGAAEGILPNKDENIRELIEQGAVKLLREFPDRSSISMSNKFGRY
jgi:hypothetical protein